MTTVVLQGKDPSGRLVPIRLDEDGRQEHVVVSSGAQPPPASDVDVTDMPALTGTINPTKPDSLAHGLLAATIGILYTFTAKHRDVVIHVCNVDTVERTFTIQVGATSPGAADDTHTRVKTHRLDAGDFTQIHLPSVDAAIVIYGLCDSANKVSFEIWGTP